MTERLVIRLYEPVQAWKAITEAWRWAKAMLIAGHRLVVEFKPETRSLKQNAKLHAVLSDISNGMEWAGKKRDVETWKRLLTAAWCRARGESIELLPALDGHGIDIVFRRTSDLTRGEMVELIDFIHAWAAEQGIELMEAA